MMFAHKRASQLQDNVFSPKSKPAIPFVDKI